MIYLSPEVAELPRIEFRTTKRCPDCKTIFVLDASKLGIFCKCRFIPVEEK